MTQPAARVVLLGASNLTRALPVVLDSVQDREVAFLATRTDPSQGVTLLASQGGGYALYSTIDLEAYLADPSSVVERVARSNS